MCIFSAPSPPQPPDPNLALRARDAAAKDAEQKERTRLGKKKGGRNFLSSGFAGVADTLLGSKVDKL